MAHRRSRHHVPGRKRLCEEAFGQAAVVSGPAFELIDDGLLTGSEVARDEPSRSRSLARAPQSPHEVPQALSRAVPLW